MYWTNITSVIGLNQFIVRLSRMLQKITFNLPPHSCQGPVRWEMYSYTDRQIRHYPLHNFARIICQKASASVSYTVQEPQLLLVISKHRQQTQRQRVTMEIECILCSDGRQTSH